MANARKMEGNAVVLHAGLKWGAMTPLGVATLRPLSSINLHYHAHSDHATTGRAATISLGSHREPKSPKHTGAVRRKAAKPAYALRMPEHPRF
jgi:hypothetical protein